MAYDRRIIINADPTNVPQREIASSHVELYESRQQTRLPGMGQAFDAVLNSRGEIWRDEKDLPDELIPRMKLRRGLSFSARGISLISLRLQRWLWRSCKDLLIKHSRILLENYSFHFESIEFIFRDTIFPFFHHISMNILTACVYTRKFK